MKYLLAILALAISVFGGKITTQSSDISYGESYDREKPSSYNAYGSSNDRIFSQEDFPAGYFYPTYPQYVESRRPNGYNGQMVVLPIDQQISSWQTVLTKLIPITSFALLYGAKAGIYLFSILLIIIVGVVVTTTICTFTPICAISFPALALTRNQVKEQIAEIARHYITAENLDATTLFVQKAVEKYVNLQAKENEVNTTDLPTSTIKPSSSTIKPSYSTIKP